MTINLQMPDIKELKPKITVFGVGGAGGNAVNNMIRSGLEGVEFVCANTDSQALMSSRATRLIQMGVAVTEGLGAGSQPEVGRAAAEEVIDEITDHLTGSHMVFVTAGMGGGTGTGAAPIIARTARDHGILTVGVVTKPFQFEGARRMRVAEAGIHELQQHVDTLIVIPNQNLFRIANEKTTFADAFAMADQVLFSGVACITDLMVKEGLINLDFADVRSVMSEMGKAMMGTGEASGDRRAQQAAEAAIANPLLDETSMRGARGLLISITGGRDLTLFEVDEAATRIREEVDPDANIILGATFDESLEGVIRVSVVATGIDAEAREDVTPTEARIVAINSRLNNGGTQQVPARPVVDGRPTTGLRQPQAAAEPRPVAPLPPAPQLEVPQGQVYARAAAPQAQAQAQAQAHAVRDGVTIGPLSMAPQTDYTAHDLEPEHVAAPVADAPESIPFIPPQPEAPPRMPRAQDFPPVGQRELQAHGRQPQPEEGAGPMGLLRKLAQGLSRREEPPVVTPSRQQPPPLARQGQQPQRPAQRPPQQAGQQPQQRPAMQQRPAQQAPQRPAAPQGDYGKRPQAQPQQRPVQDAAPYRPRQGDLDQHGRPLPRETRMEDDQLEIPAFLRRQAN